MSKMILVLISCDSFEQAKQTYEQFVKWKEETSPEDLEEKNDAILTVNLCGKYRYIFTHYFLMNLLQPDVIVDREEFLMSEGLPLHKEQWE